MSRGSVQWTGQWGTRLPCGSVEYTDWALYSGHVSEGHGSLAVQLNTLTGLCTVDTSVRDTTALRFSWIHWLGSAQWTRQWGTRLPCGSVEYTDWALHSGHVSEGHGSLAVQLNTQTRSSTWVWSVVRCVQSLWFYGYWSKLLKCCGIFRCLSSFLQHQCARETAREALPNIDCANCPPCKCWMLSSTLWHKLNVFQMHWLRRILMLDGRTIWRTRLSVHDVKYPG